MDVSQSGHRLETGRRVARLGLSIIYLTAGFAHLLFPNPFLMITPELVPYAQSVVFWTGLCEIIGGICLWVPRFAGWAGVGLALYAVCVFPANIKHAMDSLSFASATIWIWAYHSMRLPLQPVLVWLALFAGNQTDWPWTNKSRG